MADEEAVTPHRRPRLNTATILHDCKLDNKLDAFRENELNVDALLEADPEDLTDLMEALGLKIGEKIRLKKTLKKAKEGALGEVGEEGEEGEEEEEEEAAPTPEVGRPREPSGSPFAREETPERHQLKKTQSGKVVDISADALGYTGSDGSAGFKSSFWIDNYDGAPPAAAACRRRLRPARAPATRAKGRRACSSAAAAAAHWRRAFVLCAEGAPRRPQLHADIKKGDYIAQGVTGSVFKAKWAGSSHEPTSPRLRAPVSRAPPWRAPRRLSAERAACAPHRDELRGQAVCVPRGRLGPARAIYQRGVPHARTAARQPGAPAPRLARQPRAG